MTPLPALTRSQRYTTIACVLVVLIVSLLAGPHAFADKPYGETTTEAAVPRWSERTLDLFNTLPIQEGGRIKPFSVWAKFALLRINHKSTVLMADDSKRSAVEWALDTMFFPEVAKTYRVVRVDDDAFLTDLGLKRLEGRKKADRYSYKELESGLGRLQLKTDRIRARMRARGLEMKHLSRLDRGLMRLSGKVGELDRVLRFFEFGRKQLRVDRTPALKTHFGGKSEIPVSEFLPKAAALGEAMKSGTGPLAKDSTAISGLLDDLSSILNSSYDPHVLAPVAKDGEWTSPWQVARAAYVGEPVASEHQTAIEQLQRLTAASGTSAFEQELAAFHKTSQELTEARGEYGKIDLEVHFYKFDPFYRALTLYVLAFVLVAISWFMPRLRWLQWLIFGFVAVALLLQIYGIVVRSIIRDRPPIKNLYDTVVFIGGSTVLLCLITEWLNKRRIALALAPVLGALGLFVAQGYEELNRQDTLRPLQAVLDTNFWLATHVVIINLGYTAGLLAGALGCVYVLGRAFGLKSGDGEFYRSLYRMIYGTICFCLLFSLVGTILGGIWANDSWGRFWGWDPKENGALMIVLWGLMTLHARMGGYIKAHGVAMMSVALAVVVGFSWWQVNQLDFGLHSYGRTEGIQDGLNIFYAFQASVLAVGTVFWFMSRRPTPSSS